MERKILIEVTEEEYEKIKAGILEQREKELSDFSIEERIKSIVKASVSEFESKVIEDPVLSKKTRMLSKEGEFGWTENEGRSTVEFSFKFTERMPY